MIFQSLVQAANKGELILVNGGICHWHLRRDKQITIREIIVLPKQRGKGIGARILDELKQVDSAESIFAKCPVDLPANDWYRHRGFELEATSTTRSGRELNHWRLRI